MTPSVRDSPSNSVATDDADPPARYGSVRTWIARRQLLSFLVLSLLWTLVWDAVVYSFVTRSPPIVPPWTAPRAWGPLVAAVAVTWLSGGNLRQWARQLLDWRVKPRWIIAAIVIPVVATDMGSLVAAAFGASLSVSGTPLWMYVGAFLLTLLFAGALEEFGWRGFAQPRLQERYSATTAAVLIGVFWACWHLPLFVVFDMAAYDTGSFLVQYLPQLVALSLVYAWLFNVTGGSILPVMIIHAAGNLPGFLTHSTTPSGLPGVLVSYASPILWFSVAIVLVLAYGRKYLAPRSPVPAIPGFPDKNEPARE